MQNSIKLVIVAIISFTAGWISFIAFNHNNVPQYSIAVVDIPYIISLSSEVKLLKEKKENDIKKLELWADKTKNNKEFLEKKQTILNSYTDKIKIIDKEITKIIEDEAIKHGYDVVVSKSSIIVGGDDITMIIATLIK